MSCGDIFKINNNYFLQLGERENDTHAPFVLLTEEADAIELIGCDQFSPYFFIRKKSDGSFPDKDYFINVFDDHLLPLSQFNIPVVNTLKEIHMKHIQECANKHQMLSTPCYAYLNLI